MKLFVIGDSISQGFMSGAAARSDMAYSKWIAQKMGLEIGKDFRYPDWLANGLGRAAAASGGAVEAQRLRAEAGWFPRRLPSRRVRRVGYGQRSVEGFR